MRAMPPPPPRRRAALAVLVVAAVLLAVAVAGNNAQRSAVAASAPMYHYDDDAWAADDADDYGYGVAACTGTAECAVAATRRELDGGGNIGYGALQRDQTPCSYRGASYYNCRPGAAANPYSRGCSAINQCRG